MNDTVTNAVYGPAPSSRAGIALKIIIGVSLVLIFCLMMWAIVLQIAIDQMRAKQIEHEKKFQVMADALFLEVTEAEWKARGNRSVIDGAR